MVNHHQYDSAIIVMDKFQEFFPNEKFPAELHTYQFPEMYYVCGDTEKGDAYLMKLVNNYSDIVMYYGKMSQKKYLQDYIDDIFSWLIGRPQETQGQKFHRLYQDDFEEGLSLLRHFSEVAKKYERNDLAQEISDRMMLYLSEYYE